MQVLLLHIWVWRCFREHIQERDGPFPWTRPQSSFPSGHPTASSVREKRECENPEDNPECKYNKISIGYRDRTIPTSRQQMPALSPRLDALVTKCQTLSWISFKLCDLKAAAGAILQHAIDVTLALFRKEEPLIFKFGFTHNPIWRWTNPVYGYATARERWSNMLILHYGPEPYTPAMLEAALIEKFKSNSLNKHQHVFVFLGLWLLHYL